MDSTQATENDHIEETKETKSTHFVMPGKDKQLHKVEDLDQEALAQLKEMVPTMTSITLSGHSYGLEACQHIGEIIAKADNLRKINFGNIFIGKLKEEIPENLKALLQGICGKELTYVDFSDNAFGPAGVPGFDFFLKETPSIKVLKMINCGLGPSGGTSLAECLKSGSLKLSEFYAGRNRMECTGYKAIAEVLKEMGSLTKIEMPQNFVRKDGMIAMIDALKSNPELTYIHIHDNWLKEEAIKEFSGLIKSLSNLKSINISDCDIGGSGVKKIISALGSSPSHKTIEYFGCNYNEVERSKTAQHIFKIFSLCPNLKTVSFIGNLIKPQLKKQYEADFSKTGKTLILREEEEEDDPEESDEEEEISEEDEEDASEEDDEAKELQKKLENLSLE
jgi:Ran GTPase-activating protein 1